MLCEVAKRGNFFTTWLVLTLLALASMVIMSGFIFWRYYMNPTFEQWKRKSNPNYPSPQLVRKEVLQMLKGLVTAAACPAMALHLVDSGYSKAYCGTSTYGVGYLVLSFFIVWIGTDFFEFAYHRIGHVNRIAWKEHRHHHAFYNPSPFAVIADMPIDQFIRATPLVIFPLIMPINMDLLFGIFAIFFYGYGVYLHWGYELAWPDAHHPIINSSFQHYLHHAKSTLRKPYHTGFFFKIWDQIFGSMYKDQCLCAKCCVERGERTEEAWAALPKPDYSPLLTWSFWRTGEIAHEQAAAEVAAEE